MELVRDTKDRENSCAQIARLTLRHTYLPKTHVDFVCPSYFGGKYDQLVLCAGKGMFKFLKLRDIIFVFCPKLKFRILIHSRRYSYLGTRYCNFAPLRRTSGVQRELDRRCMESFHRRPIHASHGQPERYGTRMDDASRGSLI